MAIGPRGSAKATAIWIGIFVVLALVLRIAFNFGVAFDEDSDRYLYSGNDPWYHDRTVDHIVETGESLGRDAAINYPNGGRNPNPPVFDWTTAVDAKVLESTGASDPVGLALNMGVAFWGALTVIPVFMIGNALFGRKAGLWAGFFMAVSAPHVQRTVFGFADHDATAMFFITLAFAFMIKALQGLRKKEYVASWKDGAMEGMRKAWAENRISLLYSALAGVSLAAVALTWKGYPYALAILAMAFGFQLLIDHARNKDSTALTFVYIIPVLLSLLIAWPYYNGLNLGNSTITPHIYVLLGMLLAAVILVPTRDMPSIVVFPALIGAALLGILFLLLVVPQTGELIFTGLGYFRQTKLYSTIAEAQRTELGFIAANFGFFTFLLAFWAFGRNVRAGWKGDASNLLMATWALVAGFMAFAASRFVMNAAPVFVVLAGAATSWIVAKAGFDEVARRRRKLHGQGGALKSGLKSLTGKSVVMSLLIGFFLVLPNVWTGVDAATSTEFDSEHGLIDNDPDTVDRFGAYGIGFDVDNGGWYALFNMLAEKDTELPLEERPGFMGWWDYGHWATNIGEHPTVADPFQNHFEIAGRFLASESEEESTLWMAILLADANKDEAAGVFAEHGLDWGAYGGDYDEKYAVVSELENDGAFDLYHDLMDATGQEIGYLGVDSRMYPISQQESGIFYAPVFLANKNPDDFLSITYVGDGVSLELQQYDFDDNGDSYRLDTARFVDGNGDLWTVDPFTGQAYRGDQVRLGAHSQEGISVSPRFQPTDRFQDAMYTRAFGSIDGGVPAGDGLRHWKADFEVLRAVGEDDEGNERFARQVALLEYFRGHTVTGVVTDDLGQPMEGVQVTFVDELGAGHDVATTDANGNYEVLAPYGDLKLTVRAAGNDLFARDYNELTKETDGGRTDGVDITVPRGDMSGRAFRDLDGNRIFTAGDEAVAGALVEVAGMTTTTDANGNYSIGPLTAGLHDVTASKSGFEEAGNPFVLVPGGATGTGDILMAALPSEVTVTFRDGEPVSGIQVQYQGPTAVTVVTDVNGTATATLEPGTYDVIVDQAPIVDGNEVVYDVRQQLTVPFGGSPVAFTIDA